MTPDEQAQDAWEREADREWWETVTEMQAADLLDGGAR